jgi:hypothetical protein
MIFEVPMLIFGISQGISVPSCFNLTTNAYVQLMNSNPEKQTHGQQTGEFDEFQKIMMRLWLNESPKVAKDH